MKAARKVGDAKKHECRSAHHSQNSSSDPLHSKTRVHGLIRSSPSVLLCVCSYSQHRFHTPVSCPRRFIQKTRMNYFPSQKFKRCRRTAEYRENQLV